MKPVIKRRDFFGRLWDLRYRSRIRLQLRAPALIVQIKICIRRRTFKTLKKTVNISHIINNLNCRQLLGKLSNTEQQLFLSQKVEAWANPKVRHRSLDESALGKRAKKRQKT